MKKRNCSNPKECRASTGVHGGMTFGWGKLDKDGYWEFPCRECAMEYDAGRKGRIAGMVQSGHKRLELESDYFAWVTLPAWPYQQPQTGETT